MPGAFEKDDQATHVPVIPAISIVGLGALSALGEDTHSHHQAILAKRCPFRPLGELLGSGSPHAARPGAWIGNRALLTNRKWAPATMAALHVAGQAISDAGWGSDELRDAALIVGTSRGNAAGWLGPWPGRRPFKLMAASNTIHSELASAITIKHGITGPNHVLASGCSAGLDAIGIAMLLLQSGSVSRALAVAVDLPLVPMLLDNYANSGLLPDRVDLDPYHPNTSGFVPGEGAAAMALEWGHENFPKLRHYSCNSDAHDPIGIPPDGGRTSELLERAVAQHGWPVAVCPHATGTQVQSVADPALLLKTFGKSRPTVHLLKPYIGHTIGASGLLESVILTSFLATGKLPPNLSNLHSPSDFPLPPTPVEISGTVAKISHGLGGHNAILFISPS